MSTDRRRSFLARLGAGLASVAALPAFGRRAEAAPAFAFNADQEPWLAGIAGAKHKQVFDAPAVNDGFPMAFTWVYLTTMNNSYALKPGEARAVLVLRHSAAVLGLNDAMWKKYGIGKMLNLVDKGTGQPSERNLFANARPGDFVMPDASLDKLPALGVHIALCNMALTRRAAGAAQATGQSPEAVLAEWKANLVPGAMVAPSGVLAVGRAQEAGCSYCFTG